MAAVVLVVGRPASGKSTIAAAIGAELGMPVLARDDLKEILFDSLGFGDRAWSMRLGRASFDLLDHTIELLAASGASFVVDANLDARIAGPHLVDLQKRLGFDVVQVHCVATPDVLRSRFVARAATDRHPGHGDDLHVDEFVASLLEAKEEVLPLPGSVVEAVADADGRLDVREVLSRVVPLVRMA